MNLIFPAAVMANTFAMTVLMILLGLTGKSDLAADFGIVHGATLALFFAFSANARSLILNKSSNIQAKSIMFARLLLVLPLAGVSYLLSLTGGVEAGLALVLIVRRCGEWLSEVHLSDIERQDHKRHAEFYLAAQALLLVLAFVWIWLDIADPLLGLWIWALSPLLFSFKDILKSFTAAFMSWSGLSLNLVPHFGSSAIIGTTVYVFRLLIVFILGKAVAGDLFTAFAIGGLVGSIFANALGASITLHEQRSGKRHFPVFLRGALYISLVVGVGLYIAASIPFSIFEASGKSPFFWRAVGLSLIGGVVMVYAQRIRFRIIQGDEEHDVFGPDVIMNVLLLGAVPFAYYLLGIEAMGALYLLSALLAYIFYSSAAKEGVFQRLPKQVKANLWFMIPFALLFPIFFQVSEGVFRDPTFGFTSGGKLTDLPLPLSVFACYLGIVLLGNYKKAFVAYMTIFLTCMLMIATVVFSTNTNPAYQEAKLILLMQFILPMFALALGQVYSVGGSESGSWIGKAFLFVLITIIPLQLVASWAQGFAVLAPSIWLFSIYQQLQYVPVVFVSAYLVALFTLWDMPGWRLILLLLVPLMAIYVAASASMLAIGLLLLGLLMLSMFQWASNKNLLPVIVLLLASLLVWGYLGHYEGELSFKFGAAASSQVDAAASSQVDAKEESEVIPPNLNSRIEYWKHYLTGITSSPRTVLIGQETAPDRARYPSAHNYYLDFIYNFGLLALLPILVLLGITFVAVYRQRKNLKLSQSLIGLSFVVLFLIIIDNSLKVGLRQPYPGVFTFFLWGLLLNRLLVLNADGIRK